MLAIYKKEIHAYFTSFIGYTFLIFFILMTAFMFNSVNVYNSNANYADTLQNTMLIFFVLIPVLTMRLFSEEFKNKTDQLILTAPISIHKIVLAKFLSAFTIFFIAFLITMIFPLIIYFYGALNLEHTIASFFGYLLLIACFISMGIYVSSLTENQIISAIITFAVLYITFMLASISTIVPKSEIYSIIFLSIIVLSISFGFYKSEKHFMIPCVFALISFTILGFVYFYKKELLEGLIGKILLFLSLPAKFQDFYIGIFEMSNIIFFISYIILFLFLTSECLKKRCWK